MRKLLLPFSLLYWLGVIIRNLFFEKGILKIKKVEAPVISVGNISTGGSGKTPIVEMLIDKLAFRGRLAVISRGYKRKSRGTIIVSNGKGTIASVMDSGDEPNQIAHKYPKLIVVVDEDRFRGAKKAVELGAEIVLLDDGFQHRYLHRNLNIVVISAREILDGDSIIPAGNRRESLSSLRRADLIILSKCQSKSDFDRAKERILQFVKPVVGVRTKLNFYKQISTNIIVDIADEKTLAVSGIGNPKSFETLLADAGLTMVKHLVFRDHHWFDEKDIENIKRAKRQFDAEWIVTTEKDAVRLKEKFNDFIASEKVCAAVVEQEIISGDEELKNIFFKIQK